jgi:hypothetical protein
MLQADRPDLSSAQIAMPPGALIQPGNHRPERIRGAEEPMGRSVISLLEHRASWVTPAVRHDPLFPPPVSLLVRRLEKNTARSIR